MEYIAVTIEKNGFGYFIFDSPTLKDFQKILQEDFFDENRSTIPRLLITLQAKILNWAHYGAANDFRENFIEDSFNIALEHYFASSSQYLLLYDRYTLKSDETLALFIRPINTPSTSKYINFSSLPDFFEQLKDLAGKEDKKGFVYYPQIKFQESDCFLNNARYPYPPSNSDPEKLCTMIHKIGATLPQWGIGIQLRNPNTGVGWMPYGDFILAYFKGHLGKRVKPASLLTYPSEKIRNFVREHYFEGNNEENGTTTM